MKNEFKNVSAVKDYHVHVYYDNQKEMDSFLQEMQERFSNSILSIHKIGAVGPHSSKNYGIHIKRDSFSQIVPWLQLNSGKLSILIHPDTGDDIFDHLDAAMWIGKPVKFNQIFFDKLKLK